MPAEATQAARHASARWVGVPLFWVGALGLLAAIGLALTGPGSVGGVMVYVAATGLSLATFGTHNDTALALSQRVPREALGKPLQRELEQDLRTRREATVAATATPRTAWAVTFIAILLHAWALSRLLGTMA